jgi:hypothetical protein
MKSRLEFLLNVAGLSFLSLGIGALFAVHLMKAAAK